MLNPKIKREFEIRIAFWSIVSGKLEPILYYYTFRNGHKISCKPDVFLMSIRGKFKFLWKIEV